MGGNQLTLGVSTLNDSIAAGWINTNGGNSTAPGRCIPYLRYQPVLRTRLFDPEQNDRRDLDANRW